MYFLDTNLPPPPKKKILHELIMHHLRIPLYNAHEQKAVVCLCVVYPLLFNQNQCFFLNKSKEMCSFTLLVQISVCKLCNIINWFTNMSWVSLFWNWEWPDNCGCSLKGKAIQNFVLKQKKCPSFGHKSMLCRIWDSQGVVCVELHRLRTGYKTPI